MENFKPNENYVPDHDEARPVPAAVKMSLDELIKGIKPNPYANEPKGQAYRMVIIDGCNFLYNANYKIHDFDAMATGRPNARAALLLVHAFLQMGFGVIFVVKKFYDDKKNTLNPYVLKYLQRAGIVHLLDDEVDDDMEILKGAQRLGAFVVSNDNYNQDRYSKFADVKKRKIGFSCTKEGDVDPTACFSFDGRFATNLRIFLHKSLEEFKQIAICQPSGPKFREAKHMENRLDPHYRGRNIEMCNFIADYHRLQLYYAHRLSHRNLTVEVPDFFDPTKYHRMPDKFDEFFDIYKSYCPIKFSAFGIKK